jgi:hypothetical protein
MYRASAYPLDELDSRYLGRFGSGRCRDLGAFFHKLHRFTDDERPMPIGGSASGDGTENSGSFATVAAGRAA